MANHPSAEKRNRQRIVRTERNRAVKSALRTAVKKARQAVAGGDAAKAKPLVLAAETALARAASKGVVAQEDGVARHLAHRRVLREARQGEVARARSARPEPPQPRRVADAARPPPVC